MTMKSKVIRPKTASALAVLFGISVSLLLIFIQMIISLVCFAGVFILSNEALISPFHFCVPSQHGELSCDGWHRGPEGEHESKSHINFLTTVVTMCLYVPVVLVAFALLDTLLAAYAKDRAALWLGMACQASSGLLLLTGTIIFLLLHRSYVSWEHMTVGFYICVGVQVQLVFTTMLTRVSWRRLTSEWE